MKSKTEAEVLAQRMYSAYCAHMNLHNIAPPRWFALRPELKQLHIEAARSIMDGYEAWRLADADNQRPDF